MATKRLRLMSVIAATLLGLSLIALGAREFLLPGETAHGVEALRPLRGDDYSQTARVGVYIVAWGLLLLTFCWYLRVRGFWLGLALLVLLFGAITVLSPEQGLQTLKSIYVGKSYYPIVIAAVEAVVGVFLLASIRLSE